MIQKIFAALLILLTAISCSDSGDRQPRAAAQAAARRGDALEPELAKADSVELIYYVGATGDSLRYARYFRYTASSDSGIIDAVLKNLRQNAKRLDTVRPCRSEGKMILYANGDLLKTIYFSLQTGDCRYLYFIRNGIFYYFDVQANTMEKINEGRARSREP